jgi:ribose/xylose/arabinose/galactoside ABC-type transport system permease subunit
LPLDLQSLVAGGAALALVAIGQTFVVLTGGIDLSVGSVMSLTTVLAAFSMHGSDARFLPVALMCIAVGAGIGLVNGLVIGILRIEPIIVTLTLRDAPKGVELRTQWYDAKGKQLGQDKKELMGQTTATFQWSGKPLKPGKYHVVSYWGENVAGDHTFEVTK